MRHLPSLRPFVFGRIRRRIVILVTLAAAALAALPAGAVDQGPWSMEILVDGRPLDELAARGTTYVEAARGREYAIRLRNRTPRRVAVALSVDGLNTIDARTGAANASSKWILAPWQTITLTGWQTGPDTARRFYFTTEDGSYGAWLGKTDDLGLVAAAFFRERRPVPVPAPIDGGRIRRQSRAEPGAPSPSGAGESGAKRLDAANERESADALSDDYAATGIGRQVDHNVRPVRFDAEPAPAAVLRVRYEYRDALVRLGVFPRPAPDPDSPLSRRERARGFADMEFAPDPYR